MNAHIDTELIASANNDAIRLILDCAAMPHRRPVARAADAGAGVTFLLPGLTALIKKAEHGAGRIVLILGNYDEAPGPNTYPALTAELREAAVVRFVSRPNPPVAFYADVAKAALAGQVSVLVEAQPRYAAAWREVLWGEGPPDPDCAALPPGPTPLAGGAAEEEHRAAVRAVDQQLPGSVQRLMTAVERLQRARACRP